MSGITIDATGISGDLKRVYDPMMVTIFNMTPGFYKTLPELNGYRGTGAGYYFGVRVRPDKAGMGARAESGALPTAGNVIYQQGNATCKYNYKSIEATGPAIARAMKAGDTAWVDLLADDIEVSTEMLMKDLARQAWRAGTGKITETNGSGTSSTTMIVDSCRHLDPGDEIEVYTAAGAAEVASVGISAIDYPNRTLTLDAASSWSDGSYVYRDGQYNSGTGLEMMGMDGIVANASASFEGIDASTYGEWKSYVESNAGDIDRESLWKARYYAERYGNAKVDQIWTTSSQRQNIFMIVEPSVQFNRPENLEIAFVEEDDPISFGGLTFAVDDDCPSGKIFGLATGADVLGTITEKPLGIGTVLDQIDNTFLRTAGYDAYTAFISIYQNIVVKNRRAMFKIEGLNELYNA